MAKSQWITVIGILVILFGTMTLAGDIAKFFISELAEFEKKRIDSFPFLSHINFLIIPIHLLYVTSGILLLMKKAFSLNLFYISLIINIIFELMFANYLGSCIDLVLLLSVYNMKVIYFFNREEEVKYETEKGIKKSLPPKVLKVLSATSAVIVLIPVTLFALWLIASNLGSDFYETKDIYYSYLPNSMRSYGRSAYISLSCCLLSVIFSVNALKLENSLWKNLNRIVIGLSLFLFLVNLWSLM